MKGRRFTRGTKSAGGGALSASSTVTSPIARVIAELETERENLTARLGKVDAAIATMRELFHLSPTTRAPGKAARKAKAPKSERGSSKGDQAKDAIRAALVHGPMSPGDLAEKVGMERPVVRYHVKHLEANGELVSSGSTGDRRIALAGGRRPKEGP